MTFQPFRLTRRSLGHFLMGISLTTLLGGCHSAFVQSSVQNRTNSPLHLIEVDYPSASFGIEALGPNSTFQYRFKIQGSGNLKLSYTDASGKSHHFVGPEVKEGQEGNLIVAIGSADSVDWKPALSEKH